MQTIAGITRNYTHCIHLLWSGDNVDDNDDDYDDVDDDCSGGDGDDDNEE